MIFSRRVFSRSVAIAAALVSVFFLVSCEGLFPLGQDDPLDGPLYADNVVVVATYLSGTVSWQDGKVYYIDDSTTVEEGATLSIAPGAIVKFGALGKLYINDGATIVANGTALKPIVFTSIRDTAAGGDSITNDGSVGPAAGDWYFVWPMNGSGQNSFSYCEFRYAGKDGNAALYVDGATAVDQCVFRDNACGRPYIGSEEATLHFETYMPGSSVTNTLFYNNLWPLRIPVAMSLDGSNSFEFDHDNDAGTASLRNTHQGIMVAGGEINAAVSWAETDVPLCFFDNGWLNVTGTGSLSLASGLVMKFNGSYSGLWIEEGATVTAMGAIFTSFKDDTLLGDTNADLAVSSPANGDWQGIWDQRIDTDGNYWTRDNAGQVRYSFKTAGDD